MAPQTPRMLSRDQLDRASRDRNTVIYEPTYDITFEPWPVPRVLACLQKLAALTIATGSESGAREAAAKESDLREFMQTHITLANHFMNPSFVKDRHKVNTMLKVIEVRRQMADGLLTHEQAHGLVSEIVLQAGVAEANMRTPDAQ